MWNNVVTWTVRQSWVITMMSWYDHETRSRWVLAQVWFCWWTVHDHRLVARQSTSKRVRGTRCTLCLHCMSSKLLFAFKELWYNSRWLHKFNMLCLHRIWLVVYFQHSFMMPCHALTKFMPCFGMPCFDMLCFVVVMIEVSLICHDSWCYDVIHA